MIITIQQLRFDFKIDLQWFSTNFLYVGVMEAKGNRADMLFENGLLTFTKSVLSCLAVHSKENKGCHTENPWYNQANYYHHITKQNKYFICCEVFG